MLRLKNFDRKYEKYSSDSKNENYSCCRKYEKYSSDRKDDNESSDNETSE